MSATAEDLLVEIHGLVGRLRELAGDTLVISIEPATNGRVKPPPAAGRKPGRRSTRKQAVLDVLADGPLAQSEIMHRAEVPKGTMGNLMGRMERAGEIERAGLQRGRGRPSPIWKLAGATGLTISKDAPLATQVVAVIADEPCCAPHLVETLGKSMLELAPVLNELADAGKIRWNDQAQYEVAA